MKTSLIGEQITLVGAADDIAGVLLPAVVAFLEAADAEPPEAGHWQSELDAAMAALQAPSRGKLRATLLTTAEGIEVHLQLDETPERETSFLCKL